MLIPHIRVGPREVISSGTIVAEGWEPLTIHPIPGNKFRIVLVFAQIRGDERITINNTNPDETIVTILNMDHPLSATPQPIHVAHAKGKKMYMRIMSLYVGTGEAGTRTTIYTIFLDD